MALSNPSKRHLSEGAILSSACIGPGSATNVEIPANPDFDFLIIGAQTYG